MKSIDKLQNKPFRTSETIVNDIVHGIIKLPDYIQNIIDTAQFQRLRRIAQLGFTSFVYPTANYSRFEHSIGTFHLASKLIRQIKSQLEQEKIIDVTVNNTDIKCVEIAALCHDLGHGPYSHFWEHAFDGIDPPIPTEKHEKLSVEIFEELMNSTKLGKNKTIKNEIDLNEENIDLIKRIILGSFDQSKDNNKFFLFEIVANKKSGLDVDKFEYICRDSIYLGWSNKYKIHDIERIFNFFRVVKDNSTNNWHLAMRDREIFHIHDVFYYRHLLHRYGYQHKTVKALECMFKKALKTIIENVEYRNEFIKKVLPRNEIYNENIWFSKKFISKICDYHVWDIMSKYTEDIVRNIQERNLYKRYCQIKIIERENNPIKDIHKKIPKLKELLNSKLINLSADIAMSSFSLQSEKEGNPLLSVRFYEKNQTECFNFNEDNLPDLVKLESNESIIMIFIDNIPDETNIEYLRKFKQNLCFDDRDLEGMEIETEINELRLKYKFKEILY